MADRKISDLTALTTPASGDFLPIVDISEAAAATKNKRITIQSLFQGIPVNVGIGTSSPNTRLHVLGGNLKVEITNANFESGPSEITLSNLYRTGRILSGYTNSAAVTETYIAFHTNRTSESNDTVGEAMRIAGGNVGVGTSSPDSRLHVLDASGNSIRVGFTGNLNIYDAANHVFRNNGGTSEWVRIDGAGRLLVGTSSARANIFDNIPVFQVESAGQTFASITGNLNNVGGAVLLLSKSRGGAVGGTTIVNNNDEIGQITFSASDGSALRPGAKITGEVDGTPGANDMPGRLVFSTTADGAASPTERMRIASDNNINFFSGAATFNPEAITLTGAGASEEYVVTKSGVDTFRFGVDSGGPRITAGGAIRVIAGGSGGVSLAASATSWAAISDERHKTNLQPITDAFDKVGTLRAVTGRYVTDNEDVSRSFLIAQDVQAVLPEAIDDSNETQLSLRYSEIIPLLVGALKEAKERIEALEARLTAAGIK